jgi:hypothetical protein
MIVDLRVYTCIPGRLPEWLALYQAEAWPLQEKYLGKCLGFYTSIDGALHRVVHLWQYESQADRETRRAAMVADPGWKVFATKSAALGAFVSQETTMLAPTAFSPKL